MVLEPERGVWSVSIVEIPACVSQGRTIAAARRKIREALALCEEELGVSGAEVAELAASIELREEIRLPQRLKARVQRYVQAERERVATERAAARMRREAARALAQDLGLRDAGAILGLSHQTVKTLCQ